MENGTNGRIRSGSEAGRRGSAGVDAAAP
jgi:hypothetical protein